MIRIFVLIVQNVCPNVKCAFKKLYNPRMDLDDILDHPAVRAVGIFLVTFGLKLWLIHNNAVSCPFWDEWDIEARRLYKPWLEGNLTWLKLIEPHNEHRLLLPRL